MSKTSPKKKKLEFIIVFFFPDQHHSVVVRAESDFSFDFCYIIHSNQLDGVWRRTSKGGDLLSVIESATLFAIQFSMGR
jgi:hypothetical protein